MIAKHAVDRRNACGWRAAKRRHPFRHAAGGRHHGCGGARSAMTAGFLGVLGTRADANCGSPAIRRWARRHDRVAWRRWHHRGGCCHRPRRRSCAFSGLARCWRRLRQVALRLRRVLRRNYGYRRCRWHRRCRLRWPLVSLLSPRRAWSGGSWGGAW